YRASTPVRPTCRRRGAPPAPFLPASPPGQDCGCGRRRTLPVHGYIRFYLVRSGGRCTPPDQTAFSLPPHFRFCCRCRRAPPRMPVVALPTAPSCKARSPPDSALVPLALALPAPAHGDIQETQPERLRRLP